MDDLKKYWPWGLGLVGAYFVYTKYFSAAAASNSGSLSGMLAAQSAAGAQAAQVALSQQSLSAQQEAAQNAASVASTNASANLATATGGAISQIIAAQSAIPALAINTAGANNQTALQASAQLAETAYATLPQAMNAQANQIVAVNQQFGDYMAGSTNITTSALNSTAVGLNAVGNNSANLGNQKTLEYANAQQANIQSQQQTNQMITTGIGLGLLAFSDERLKTNIKQIGTLGSINLYSWIWNKKAVELGFPDDELQYGVIAQEVMRVHPDAVLMDKSGYLKVDYREVIRFFAQTFKAAA